MAESFFATLECELLAAPSFRTHAEASAPLFDFIEVFYNRQRRHSALGYLSPESFEEEDPQKHRSSPSHSLSTKTGQLQPHVAVPQPHQNRWDA